MSRADLIKEPGYPLARVAAGRVHRHFSVAGLAPDRDTIEAIIDVAFWASLRREETQTPRISLAFVTPDYVDMPLMLERPVLLASQALTRLGPAADRPGIHLCISLRDGELVVWGATRNLPEFCFVLEVVGPGLLVVKQSRGDESGKFVNVAVLQGDELKVLAQDMSANCFPARVAALLGLGAESVLLQLAVSMQGHGRGGSLLVVPAGSDRWRESVLHPIAFSVSPAFSGMVELMKTDPAERLRRRWQESLRRAIDGFAGLTAVDGATVITDRYELLAFGAKILRRPECGRVDRVAITEPTEDGVAVLAESGQLGGTRHLSAAQFAHDQRDAIALVASQDGRFTVFGWSEPEQIVYGCRVETLLL